MTILNKMKSQLCLRNNVQKHIDLALLSTESNEYDQPCNILGNLVFFWITLLSTSAILERNSATLPKCRWNTVLARFDKRLHLALVSSVWPKTTRVFDCDFHKVSFYDSKVQEGQYEDRGSRKKWIGMKSTVDCQASKHKNCLWLCESIANTNKPFAICSCIPAGRVQAYINTLIHAKWTNFEVPPVFAFKLILHQLLNVPV